MDGGSNENIRGPPKLFVVRRLIGHLVGAQRLGLSRGFRRQVGQSEKSLEAWEASLNEWKSEHPEITEL